MLAALQIVIDIRNDLCVRLPPDSKITIQTDLFHEEFKRNFNVNAKVSFLASEQPLSDVVVTKNTTLDIPSMADRACFRHQYPASTSRDHSRAQKLLGVLVEPVGPHPVPAEAGQMAVEMLLKKAEAIRSELSEQNGRLGRLSKDAALLRANLIAFTAVSCLAYLAGTYLLVRAVKRRLKSQRI